MQPVAASAVAFRERAAYRRRDAAGAPPHTERLAVGASTTGTIPIVAAKPPGRLRRDGGAVLDLAVSRPTVGEHFRFDMDDEFVAVRRECLDIAGFEHPLGH